MRYASQKRNGGAGLILLLALGTLVAVAAGAYWMFKKPAVLPLSEAQSIADPFLAQIRSGQVDSAWASTASDFKSYLGREGFRRFVARQPALKAPLEFVETQKIELDGSPRLECSYRSTAKPPQKPSQVRVLLAAEAGQWKVERCEVNPPLATASKK